MKPMTMTEAVNKAQMENYSRRRHLFLKKLSKLLNEYPEFLRSIVEYQKLTNKPK